MSFESMASMYVPELRDGICLDCKTGETSQVPGNIFPLFSDTLSEQELRSAFAGNKNVYVYTGNSGVPVFPPSGAPTKSIVFSFRIS